MQQGREMTRTRAYSVHHTSDIPTNEQLTTFTFPDDTPILSRSRCPGRAIVIIVIKRWLSDSRNVTRHPPRQATNLQMTHRTQETSSKTKNARSPLRPDYKVLLYSFNLKPIWKYGSNL